MAGEYIIKYITRGLEKFVKTYILRKLEKYQSAELSSYLLYLRMYCYIFEALGAF